MKGIHFLVVPLLLITSVLAFTKAPDEKVAPATVLWSEDWEGNWINDWHVDAGTWEVGIPTSGPFGGPHSGNQCAATELDGDYSEGVDTRLIRHTAFTVPPESENPRLRFWQWYDFYTDDIGEVQIKEGANPWQTISVTYYYTGGGVWSCPSIDLSPFSGSAVQIAFRFRSHNYAGGTPDVSPGWYIDDVAVVTGPFGVPAGFEAGIGDWGAEGGTWEIGIPTAGPGSALSLPFCAGTVLGDNYQEPEDWGVILKSRLTSPPILVPDVGENPALRFWHWFSFSTDDYGELQIKAGNNWWERISGTSTFSGSGGTSWSPYYVSLSDYANSVVRIGFCFNAHNYAGGSQDVSSGWYIDDVNIDGLVPVALQRYGGRWMKDHVEVTWVLQEVGSNVTFNISRKDGALGHYLTISDLEIIQDENEFSFQDRSAQSGRTYIYRVAVLEDGSVAASFETMVSVPSIAFALEQNHPNPFNLSTKIGFSTDRDALAVLSIYDVVGRLVRTLVNHRLTPGKYTEEWDGRDASGDEVASGIYFYHLKVGKKSVNRKAVLLR